MLQGGEGNDTLTLPNTLGFTGDLLGDGGDDLLIGGIGGDDLFGGEGHDTLLAGDNIDRLFGDGGDDTLDAGAGGDSLAGGQGIDSLTGGSGLDRFEAYSIDLSDIHGDRITDYEAGEKIALMSTSLAGGASQVQLVAAGPDTQLQIDADNNGSFETVLTLTGAITGNIILTSENGLTNNIIRIVVPDAHIVGDNNDNTLVGGAGNDTIEGLGGNDVLIGNQGADVLDGGAGQDTASYVDATTGVTVSLTDPSVNTGEALGDTFISIERLRGSAFDDTLVGNGQDNQLEGGAGADFLDGRGGVDWARYNSAPAGVTVDLTGITPNTGDAAGDTFASIENLMGSAFADTLIGDGGTNFLRGNGGPDALFGGGDDDHADYRGSNIGLTVSLATPAVNTGQAAGDSYVSIEGIVGTAFADHLIGDGNRNFLDGNGGADVLDGGGDFDYARYQSADAAVTASLADPSINSGDAAGDSYISIEGLIGTDFADTLIGDGGDNILFGNSSGDVLDGGAGFDIAGYTRFFPDRESPIVASLANSSINQGQAAGDTYISIEGLQGSGFDDILIGNANANRLIGQGGDDTLQGGAGADELIGSGGSDAASYAGAAAAVTADLGNAAANNTGEALGDTYTSIENLHGSAFNDFLIGNAGANTLIGGDGNDFLRGRGGADSLIGGNGSDWADYRLVPAAVTVNLANPSLNTGDAAGDTFTSIENIRGSDNNDSLTGDGAINFLRGGLGADSLDGGSNADWADYFGAGAAVTVNLANSSLNAGEAAGDTFTSIENIRGSDHNDLLTGDAGTNFMRGELGADTLDGGGDDITRTIEAPVSD